MVKRVVGAAICAGALVLAGCGSDETSKGDATPVMPSAATAAATSSAAASSSAAPGVLAPTDSGRSANANGMEALILSVEDVQSRYGPVTVFTFQVINNGSKVFDGYNWSAPTVVYGPAGTPAKHTVSLSEGNGYGKGVEGSIPPGSRQTVEHAYQVSKAQLNPAVVTAGSVLWQGDFSVFQR